MKVRAQHLAPRRSRLPTFLIAGLVVVVVVAVAAVFAASRHSPPRPVVLPPHANAEAPGKIILPHRNLPDAFVLNADGRYYVYSSQTGFATAPARVTVSDGRSLLKWGKTGSALATLPKWAENGFTWAPDVRKIDGRYVMYYDAWSLKSMFFQAKALGTEQRAECIGAATSKNPAGPFKPVKGPPIVCQFNHHGAIDPRTFVAPDGVLYLDWKSDDNANPFHTKPSHIFAQRLSKNGERLIGARHLLLSGSHSYWDGGLVEAPDMVHAGGAYWMFFSGTWYNGPAYAVGIAKCSSPIGPCRMTSSKPWLRSNAQGEGPGEESLFHNSHGWWMAYSPWSTYYHPYRPVAIAKVAFGPKGPYLAKIPASQLGPTS